MTGQRKDVGVIVLVDGPIRRRLSGRRPSTVHFLDNTRPSPLLLYPHGLFRAYPVRTGTSHQSTPMEDKERGGVMMQAWPITAPPVSYPGQPGGTEGGEAREKKNRHVMSWRYWRHMCRFSCRPLVQPSQAPSVSSPQRPGLGAGRSPRSPRLLPSLASVRDGV